MEWECILPLDYVVIDFETTGFNPYNDKIIQVAVKYRNHELEINLFHT